MYKFKIDTQTDASHYNDYCIIYFNSQQHSQIALEKNFCMHFFIIIIIIKKGRQCKAEREWYQRTFWWYTPYQSEDLSPTVPTYRQKEEKGKKLERLDQLLFTFQLSVTWHWRHAQAMFFYIHTVTYMIIIYMNIVNSYHLSSIRSLIILELILSIL